MPPDRPDPDALLAKVEREQATAHRGRLKIFFGAAAGVGKTYAMLQTAQERRAEGLDVVAGIVETHGRKETAALLQGISQLPPRVLRHRGASLRELDLDAALKRKPAILLVDELAHSNIPGSRHPKRWQDVEELLEAGIHVYTTLNVQHLESLNDDVGQIAGIRIWETVPDTVFEQADEIELVDLPPDELLLRLKEGKVYLPEQAQRAIENFFRKGNLIALRELALRQTASRVDAQMQDYRVDHAIREVWQVGERILVCIGPNGLAERLIRAGKRLAAGLRAEWIVVYVETPELQRLPAERRDAILRVLRQAGQLGAETVTLSAPEMAQAILDFARRRNVTKLVMGKPGRRGWRRWLMGSVVDTLIAEAHNINLYLLGSPRGDQDAEVEAIPASHHSPPGLGKPSVHSLSRRLRAYAMSGGVMLFCTLIAHLLSGYFQPVNLLLIYLLGVIFVAVRLGPWPSVLASVLAVAAYDFLFVPPYFTFRVDDSQYLATFVGIVALAVMTSRLMLSVRYQARVAEHRERRASVLYAVAREMAAARSEEEVMRILVRHVCAEFGSRNAVLMPDANGRILLPHGRRMEESLRDADTSVAQWVYDHNEMAGQGTYTLAGAKAVYFPIASNDQAIGVLAMLPLNLRRVFLPEQRKLLDAFLGQAVQAIERVRLAEQAREASVQVEGEHLRNSLLSSISHDLRTPLATIVGSAATLADAGTELECEAARELGRAIHEEAQRMVSLVNNILDMARLDAGAVRMNRQWHVLDDIVGAVLTRLQRRLEGRQVNVKLPPESTLIHVDAVMIEQVLANLLENAARYTPPGSDIEISAERSAFAVTVSVADRGPGIPHGQEEQLFEKFYRVRQEGAQSGAGLGLSICKAIVEAHGGWIQANNRGSGGAVFSFLLPVEQAPPLVEEEEA